MKVNPEPRTVVIVLANEMDRYGNLNSETRGRLEMGCLLAREESADELLFMGWAYREDNNLPISAAMQAEALRRGLCPGITTRCNRLSRDTVGDAIFSAADYWPGLDRIDPIVVTSDYHAARAGLIFSFVWGRDVPVIGAETGDLGETDAAEARSIAAFRRTFDGVNPGDLPGCATRLVRAHPFYNNSAMPNRPFSPGLLGGVLDDAGQSN